MALIDLNHWMILSVVHMTKIKILFILLFILPVSSYANDFFQWSSNNIQLLRGNGFELGDSQRLTITYEHINGWHYGENFLFLDVVHRNDVGIELYGEWYPRLSLGKITNRDLSFFIIKDFSIVGGINAGSEPSSDPFKAYLFGGGLKLDLPYFDFLNLDVYAYKSDNVESYGFQITPFWKIPFNIGNINLVFHGFLDYASKGATGGKSYILAQPQLLVDLKKTFGIKHNVFMGIEYMYWRNKFGISNVDEESIQAMVSLEF